MTSLQAFGAAFAITLVLITSLSQAGTLKVSPVKVSLPAGGNSGTIRVENPDPTPVLVQVEAVDWTTAEDPKDAKRADEILAVPPIFKMAPNSEQIIRLVHRDGGSAATEKAFRLLITEIPEDADDGGVSFAVRLNMPLFVTPQDAAADPEWRLQYTDRGETALIVTNNGNAHLMVKSLELLETGESEPLYETDKFTYVLAGDEQRWSLGYDEKVLPDSLEILSNTNLGLQQLPVTTQ